MFCVSFCWGRNFAEIWQPWILAPFCVCLPAGGKHTWITELNWSNVHLNLDPRKIYGHATHFQQIQDDEDWEKGDLTDLLGWYVKVADMS